MSERKAIAWFSDEPQPNTFFFRSPFHSPRFVLCTVLLCGICVAAVWMLWDYPAAFRSFPSYLLLLLVFGVVYPYSHALRRHRKLYKHYRVGSLTAQQVGSPLNDLLEIAEKSLIEGILNAAVLVGFLLFTFYLWKWEHLK